MKRNIATQRLAMVMAAALAVGLLATDAQARGGNGFGGGFPWWRRLRRWRFPRRHDHRAQRIRPWRQPHLPP
jgi:hypothetical protein